MEIILHYGSSISWTIKTIKHIYNELEYDIPKNLPIAELNNGTDIPEIELLVGKEYIYIYRKDIKDKDFPENNVLVGKVRIDENINPIKFKKDREDVLISDTFDKLSNIDFFAQIRQSFQVPNLGKTANQEVIKIKQEENRLIAEMEKKRQKIQSLILQSSFGSRDILYPDEDKVKFVKQNDFGIVKGEDPFEYISTIGVATCIAISVWNKKTKDVGIIHMDAKTPFAKLDQLFIELGNNKDDLVIDVVGARALDVSTGMKYHALDNLIMDQLLQTIKNITSKGFKIRSYDVLDITGNQQKDIKDIVLDKKTGTLYNYVK